MSEMLQVNTIAPKNYNLSAKPVNQNDQVFDLVDLSKVIKTSDRTEQYKQENSSFDESNSVIPKNQMMISKDPSLASSSLKSILSNDVISQLRESGNSELLEKLNSFASEVMLSPDKLISDILSQQGKLTMFNGQFFDLLRQLNNSTINADLKLAIQSMLKSISTNMSGQKILDSVSANLMYLSEQLSASRSLSEALHNLSLKFSSPDARNDFASLKAEAFTLLENANNSLLLTEKLKNLIPLIKYNLSRFNENPGAIKDNLTNLLSYLSNDETKASLKSSLSDFIENNMPENIKNELLPNGSATYENTLSLARDAAQNAGSLNIDKLNSELNSLSTDKGADSIRDILMKVLPESSRSNVNMLIDGFNSDKNLNSLLDKLSVILNSINEMDVKVSLAQSMNDALSKLAKRQGVDYIPPNSMESMVSFLSKNINDNALRSLQGFSQSELLGGLLTAPGVFTPLLHYLVPLKYNDTNAYGELWADNQSDEDNSQHLFLSFSVENIGDFELEVITKDSELSMALLCPPDLSEIFAKKRAGFSKLISSCGYSSKNMVVAPLLAKHTLTDVFPKISEKRSGLNVSI